MSDIGITMERCGECGHKQSKMAIYSTGGECEQCGALFPRNQRLDYP